MDPESTRTTPRISERVSVKLSNLKAESLFILGMILRNEKVVEANYRLVRSIERN